MKGIDPTPIPREAWGHIERTISGVYGRKTCPKRGASHHTEQIFVPVQHTIHLPRR